MPARHIMVPASLIVVFVAGCAAPVMNAPGRPVADSDTVMIDGFVQISAHGNSISDATSARVQAIAADRGPIGVARGLITAPRPGGRVNAVAQALTMQGVEPVIVLEPEATAIEVTIFRTVPSGCPDWANARLPTPMDTLTRHRNPYPSDELGLGCTLQSSLDSMVANPADLSDPPRRMSAAHAAGLAAASERYRTTGPRELPARQSVVSAF